MFPVLTTSPPYFFTPGYWGLESRPFLVEPVPFLWAASTLKEKRAGAEVDWGMATTRPEETVDARAERPTLATEVAKPMREAMVLVERESLEHTGVSVR
jgi:hypothetical protein